jgi:nitroimidazol reductase NimA-like FMN-containing flavoprotein (pyridoxamine 5'-phosphate oxidase superfamily)
MDCTSTNHQGSRTEIRRRPDRGSADRTDLDAILDAGLICHVGFVHDGGPVVIPTIYARAGDSLYLHGSPASRRLRGLAGGVDVCVTVSLVDGLVLAKSWMHHSMNYRSAVIFGRATVVDDRDAKMAALQVVVEHVQPGRSAMSRPPSPKELTGTLVLALPLIEWSVKARTGGPIDDPDDEALDWFAGVVPIPEGRLGAGR